MVIQKSRLLITTLVATVFLCSCFSNRKLDYDYGEVEGYRFYQGFYSSLSDGSDKKPLFESITIDGIDYPIDADNITTFYYEDYVACLYKYSENKWAIIDYDIKKSNQLLIETYFAESVRFIMPNYYPVFSVKYYNGGSNYSTTYNLLYDSKIITSQEELQSINSYGYFSLKKGNTTYTTFDANSHYEFNDEYIAIYNISNLETVCLHSIWTEESETISFDCLSFEKKNVESQSLGKIDKTISYGKNFFRNMDCSIWIENINGSLYLNGLGIDKTFLEKTPNNYVTGYHLKYYKEFNCVIVDYPSSQEFTYSLDYKSFSRKTFKSFHEESFKYKIFENDKYLFTCENIYRMVGPAGELKLDTYLIRYDKANDKNEIMQKQYAHGLSNVLTFSYVYSSN